jgi:hypothetical protein
MNSCYVANDAVVISDRAIYTRETGKEEGWILKIVDSGSAGSFDPLFKTETYFSRDTRKEKGRKG